jgi:hypothetical protein
MINEDLSSVEMQNSVPVPPSTRGSSGLSR